MNVIETLDKELQGKHWTLEEKVRHIYLRVCQIFIFDYRYRLASQLPNKEEIIKKLADHQINLTNLTNRYLVCPSYTENVMPVLLAELLSLSCKTLKEGVHFYPVVTIDNKDIALDATIMDLLRVKMNLTTNGYQPVGLDESDPLTASAYYAHLKEIDKEIGYIDTDYEDAFIKECGKKFNERYLRGEYGQVTEHPDDAFLKKIQFINQLYKKYKVSDNFTDARFCIGYLINKIFTDEEKIHQVGTTLFQENDIEKEWNLLHVWRFQLNNTAIYFTLKKIGEYYHFDENPYNDILKYQEYRGERKALLLTDPNTKVLL